MTGAVGADGLNRSQIVCAASTAASASAIQADPSEPVIGEAVCFTYTPTRPHTAAPA